MNTVLKLIFCVLGVWWVNFGLEYREGQLEQALKDKVYAETSELRKLHPIAHLHTLFSGVLTKEIRNASTAYYQNDRRVQYQLATMNPCNPRISSCI